MARMLTLCGLNIRRRCSEWVAAQSSPSFFSDVYLQSWFRRLSTAPNHVGCSSALQQEGRFHAAHGAQVSQSSAADQDSELVDDASSHLVPLDLSDTSPRDFCARLRPAFETALFTYIVQVGALRCHKRVVFLEVRVLDLLVMPSDDVMSAAAVVSGAVEATTRPAVGKQVVDTAPLMTASTEVARATSLLAPVQPEQSEAAGAVGARAPPRSAPVSHVPCGR